MTQRVELSEDQVREVLARAEEIQHDHLAHSRLGGDLDSVLAAAEEAGLTREAVLQALQERIGLPETCPVPGEIVFARSADGKFYAAEVSAVDGNAVSVAFLKGGERRLTLEGIRSGSIVPGQRLSCPWPDWGWWSCTVLRFDRAGGRVRVTDNWGSERWFQLSDVRFEPPKPASKLSKWLRRRGAWFALAIVGLSGAILGGALTLLAIRLLG
jgi:hypothetical protein